jgi:RNA polymerase sigma factor (sigma-70 family)
MTSEGFNESGKERAADRQPSAGQVTRLLDAIGSSESADEQLLLLVYDELRRLAAQRLSREPPNQTLQPTALVHEAYLRLIGTDRLLEPSESGDQDCSDENPPPGPPPRWDSRGHFFAAAAEAMRRILVENARRKKRIKHGGQWQRIELLEADVVGVSGDDESLLALDEALQEFIAESPEKAELVKLRYFAGLSEAEAADLLGISRATASRWWAFSRAWLFDRLRDEKTSPNQPDS